MTTSNEIKISLTFSNAVRMKQFLRIWLNWFVMFNDIHSMKRKKYAQKKLSMS